jgi:hypothetical protein
MVSRMINCTPMALTRAMNSTCERNYRGYLNDLFLEGLLYKKSIVDGDTKTRSGRRVGTLYALTERGAETIAEMGEASDNGIYYYKEGIKAKSPFGYTHRALLIEVIGEFLRLEKQGKLQVLDVIPDFQKDGASRFGTSKAIAKVKTDVGFIVPDALMKILIGEKTRIIALELHRTTSTTGINRQLVHHSEAIRKRLFSDFFGELGTSFVCSVHKEDSTLKNTLRLIREGRFPNFETYAKGYHFTSMDTLREHGIEAAFFHANGERSRLFHS